MATPEELEDHRRPRAHDNAWYADHARLINERLDMDYGTAHSDLAPATRSSA